jgi:hypothetical protein
MTTPSGQISLSDVNTELGYSATALITMNDAAVRTLAGVGGSGTMISMQDLQNKSNIVVANLTIASPTANYTLNTAKVSGYSAGKTQVTLTINSGVFITSDSTGSYALTVDTSWNASDTVTIVNNGVIIGRGGNGGNGVGGTGPANAGSAAGPALLVQRAITMNNLNRISGGGGGGGAGRGYDFSFGKGFPVTNYAGSGGGGGIGNGSGGSGANSGTSGTTTAAGPGGPGTGPSPSLSVGGNGGSYASTGSQGSPTNSGGAGGAGGAAIVGNSNITYTNTGTRNGSVS